MSEPSTCPHCSGEGKNANDTAVDVDATGQENAAPEACKVGSPCCCSCVRKLCVVLAIALIGYLAVSLVLNAKRANLERTYRMASTNQLKEIGLAMHEYEQKYGCFPPAYVADKDGRPMHSWRVLLLPFMGEDGLYAAYHFDEPWDGPKNRELVESGMGAQWFQCLSPMGRHAGNSITTDYMMVVGPHTISDGPHSRKVKEITDGLADTIMVVEVADSGVPWNKPVDLQFDQMNFRINSDKRMCISGNHPGGANVVFCDASVRWLDEKTNPELVKAMLTIDGGEPIPKDR